MEQTARKILVIDDEQSYREIISIALQMTGYDCIEATNGLDGLAAAKMNSPDLILCDINMPKMNGHELLKALKEEPEFAGTPFIFLTGESGTGSIRKGMQEGADDYLTKPFSAAELVTAVETRLAKKNSMQKFYESQFDDIKANIVHSLPHEFRTPLNGILGFSQILMEEEITSGAEVKEIGTMIHKSGKRLHHLLENMVLFGQLQLWIHDQNKIQELRRESTTLLNAVQSVVDKMTTVHHRKGSVHSTLCESALQISALYLMKILQEIIDNALKFSDEQTIVTLSGETHGSYLHIIIRDTGRGMNEEQLQKISGFQQFERGYYEQQGAGLGLSITKMLVEIHGGMFSIESAQNKGTSITVSLPMAAND